MLLAAFLILAQFFLNSSLGPFINYVRVPRERGLEKSIHTLTLGEGSNWNSYVIFSKLIFYIRNHYFKSVIGL